MLIQLDGRKVSGITLINEPDATLYPIKELPPSDLLLKGFKWLQSQRPLSRQDIFN
jgi:hypothetical protein